MVVHCTIYSFAMNAKFIVMLDFMGLLMYLSAPQIQFSMGDPPYLLYHFTNINTQNLHQNLSLLNFGFVPNLIPSLDAHSTKLTFRVRCHIDASTYLPEPIYPSCHQSIVRDINQSSLVCESAENKWHVHTHVFAREIIDVKMGMQPKTPDDDPLEIVVDKHCLFDRPPGHLEYAGAVDEFSKQTSNPSFHHYYSPDEKSLLAVSHIFPTNPFKSSEHKSKNQPINQVAALQMTQFAINQFRSSIQPQSRGLDTIVSAIGDGKVRFEAAE